MTVEDLRLFLNYVADKEQSGNSLSPVEYNLLLVRGQEDFFNRIYGLFQEYTVNQPAPRVAYEVSQYVTDAMLPFKVYIPAQAVDANGQLPIPANYYHHSSLRYTVNKPARCPSDPPLQEVKTIKILKDSEIGGILSDSNKKPSRWRASACYYNGYVQIFPANATTSVQYTYLSEPTAPVWGYTVVDGVEVYDPTTSVQLSFPAFTHRDIAMIILSYMGINLDKETLAGYAEALKQKGT